MDQNIVLAELKSILDVIRYTSIISKFVLEWFLSSKFVPVYFHPFAPALLCSEQSLSMGNQKQCLHSYFS